MLKRTRSAIHRTEYHLVFHTKYRKRIFQARIAQKAGEILKTTALKRNWEVQELEVMPDHVHILISIPPQETISRVVKQLKGVSSYCLFREFPDLFNELRKGHLWAPSYFVRSVGNVTIGTVKKYIKEQEKKYEPK